MRKVNLCWFALKWTSKVTGGCLSPDFAIPHGSASILGNLMWDLIDVSDAYWLRDLSKPGEFKAYRISFIRSIDEGHGMWTIHVMSWDPAETITIY
jgi:hypothetical protein